MTDAPDWGVLEIEGVTGLAERAVRRVRDSWPTLALETDDLMQEATIALVTKRDLIGLARSEEFALLAHGLYCDLVDYAKRQHRRLRLNTSYEAILEGVVE